MEPKWNHFRIDRPMLTVNHTVPSNTGFRRTGGHDDRASPPRAKSGGQRAWTGWVRKRSPDKGRAASSKLAAAPPFRPLSGQDELFPHGRARGGNVELGHHGCLVAGHFVSLAVGLLLPGHFEIAHPAINVADDID